MPKNPNEVAYVGSEKHFADVIKNSGDGDLLIWRQPEEDFNTNSSLIVMPGEEAIFIKDGVIEKVFDKGTYKLSTENYPFLSRLRNALTGGISTFNCVVYFVRKAHSAEILWGTNSPIQVRDKLLGITTAIKAHGSYKIQVENPTVFLEKLVGNNIPFQTQTDINKYFSNEFQSKIKTELTKAVNETTDELLGIESRLEELSEMIEPSFINILDAYGLKCIRFVISALQIDENELRRKYDEIAMGVIEKVRFADADVLAKVRNAQGDEEVFRILGEKWGKLRAAEILNNLANNPGAGGVAATGAGIGMGFAAGNAFGNLAGQMFTPMNPQTQSPNKGQQPQSDSSAKSRFTSKDAGSNSEDPMETLKKLKNLLDAGLIAQSDYDEKKEEILKRM